MSSAICFNLGQSKILSSGNGLNKHPLIIACYILAILVKCCFFPLHVYDIFLAGVTNWKKKKLFIV